MMTSEKTLILCVDDNREWLLLAQCLLENEGFAVCTADSAHKGLEAVVQAKPDMVLLDVLMPDMDGYQFCGKLQEREDLALIPVIFLSALDTVRDKSKALACGAVDYLVKHDGAEGLIDLVRRHLRNRATWHHLIQERRAPRHDFKAFRRFAVEKLHLAPPGAEFQITPENLYGVAASSGIVTSDVARCLAEFMGMPYIDRIDPCEVQLGILPTSFCKANLVVAIADASGTCFVLSNPFHYELLDSLRRLHDAGRNGRFAITRPDQIAELFKGFSFGKAPATAAPKTPLEMPTVAEIQDEFGRFHAGLGDAPDAAAEPDVTEESEPLVRLVHRILEDACTQGASDIHIAAGEREVVVRYRIDGDLRVVHRLHPRGLIRPIVSRIKILSNMDISEHRLPQDGRATFKEHVDLRIATAPIQFGEEVVIRLLDKRASAQPIDEQGFSPRNATLYREKLHAPYGLILHVGPTGSGKSTTLFSAVRELQDPSISIHTIEDPVELRVEGLSQIQVHAEIGLTFHRALRSILRLDPDVILVGEIRDRETAQVAVEAAITGHMLLSTLHTNDAAATPFRLIEMGIEPFMVSPSVLLVCAQRLLRRLCAHCKAQYVPTADQRRLAGILGDQECPLFQPRGCRACDGVGYRGRLGVHEILVPDDALRAELCRTGSTAEGLKRMAVEIGGMTTLYWDAAEKARAGVTSLEEVLSQIRKDEFDARPAWMFEEQGVAPPVVQDARPL